MVPAFTQRMRFSGTQSMMVTNIDCVIHDLLGFVTKTWPDSRNKDQQNKTMQAVVTVFGIVF